ncbi:MAG TPA: HAD family phosphatase [Vicinamibacterales bacterium]|jgi:beta-phosphoglucomutase|nr:HAD family phosphatase [Vicinamibacterales bacterium]
MIAAIVFDFDGVLADSEPLHFRALQEVLALRGATLSIDEYSSRYLGYNDVDTFRVLSDDRRWSLSEAEVEALVDRKTRVLEGLVAGNDVLYRGAATCVERLAAGYPLGIASGAHPHEIEAILARYDLRRHFRFIVGSGDTPNSKPAPDPYRRAAELHGFPPDACLAVEDSIWGIESAHAAGLRCIGITHTYPRSALKGADVIVDSLDELTVTLIAGITAKQRSDR